MKQNAEIVIHVGEIMKKYNNLNLLSMYESHERNYL